MFPCDEKVVRLLNNSEMFSFLSNRVFFWAKCSTENFSINGKQETTEKKEKHETFDTQINESFFIWRKKNVVFLFLF